MRLFKRAMASIWEDPENLKKPTSIGLTSEQRERLYKLHSELGLSRSEFMICMLDFVEANWEIFKTAFFREIEFAKLAREAYKKWRDTRKTLGASDTEEFKAFHEYTEKYETAWKIRIEDLDNSFSPV